MATGYSVGNSWVVASDVPAAGAGLAPISLTAGEISSPSADVLANVFATFQLNVAPFTRYRSNGSALVGVGV